MLVPVQFPDDLVIACPGDIEERYQTEVVGAGFFPVNVVPPPGDFGSCFERQPEQREPVFADLPG